MQVMHGSNTRVAHLFCCLPTTFVLPKEGAAFTDAFHKAAYGVECSVTQPKGLNLWCVAVHVLDAGKRVHHLVQARGCTIWCKQEGAPFDASKRGHHLVQARTVTHPNKAPVPSNKASLQSVRLLLTSLVARDGVQEGLCTWAVCADECWFASCGRQLQRAYCLRACTCGACAVLSSSQVSSACPPRA